LAYYLLTKSAFALGLVGLFAALNHSSLTYWRVVADAVDRKNLMIATQSVMLTSAGLLTAVTIFGLKNVWPIYV
jgi:hypothetical protein